MVLRHVLRAHFYCVGIFPKLDASCETVRFGLDLRRLVHTTAGVALATGFLTFISFVHVRLVKHYFNAHEAWSLCSRKPYR